jgi:PKD repeat protein
MKHLNYLLCYFFLFSILLISCKKEDTKPAPIASFTISKTSAIVSETITFTSTSQNATSYSWDFGDGNTSTNMNPTHVYSSAGTFSVTLTAIGEGGENTSSQSITIAFPAPVASFTMDKITAATGETITFTNTSVNATSYSWDFGDGGTSTHQNPTHAYSSAGNYLITLKATGDGGLTQVSQSIEITVLAITGKWIGSNVSAGISVIYTLGETNGVLSGFITVLRIQTGSMSNLLYTTSGSFNKTTSVVNFQTTSGFNFKYEYTGTYNGKNNIDGKIKATNMSEVSLNLTRQ